MNTELLITFAQEISRNKYASSHVNAAHARSIETHIKNPPPAFSLFPTPDQFEDAIQYLEALAHAFDEIAYAVAVDASGNSTIPFSTKDRVSIFSGALSESGLLSDLEEAGERLREDHLEAAE